MADLYDTLFGEREGKKAFFYRDAEGRLRYAGGPGGGGGSGSAGGSGGNFVGKYTPTAKDKQGVTVLMQNLPQQGYQVRVSTENGLTPNIQRVVGDRIPYSTYRQVDKYTGLFIAPDTGKIKPEWIHDVTRALEFLGATPTVSD